IRFNNRGFQQREGVSTMGSKRFWLAASVVVGVALVGQTARLPADAPSGSGATGRSAGGKCDKSSQVRAEGQRGDRGSAVADDQGGGKAGKGRKGKGGKAAQFGGGKGRGKGGRGLSVDQIVERLMSFDKDNDGKLTKDELPERMQGLIARGDTNKDGALDKEEIRKLASTLTRDDFVGNFGGFGGFKGKGQGKGGVGGPFAGKGPVGPKGGPRGAAVAALDELSLTGTTKEKAEAIVKAHQADVRRLLDMARSDLLVKMKDVLNEQEYKTFKQGLDRRPPPGFVGTNAPRPELE